VLLYVCLVLLVFHRVLVSLQHGGLHLLALVDSVDRALTYARLGQGLARRLAGGILDFGSFQAFHLCAQITLP
jgi:hypothetical protein